MIHLDYFGAMSPSYLEALENLCRNPILKEGSLLYVTTNRKRRWSTEPKIIKSEWSKMRAKMSEIAHFTAEDVIKSHISKHGLVFEKISELNYKGKRSCPMLQEGFIVKGVEFKVVK